MQTTIEDSKICLSDKITKKLIRCRLEAGSYAAKSNDTNLMRQHGLISQVYQNLNYDRAILRYRLYEQPVRVIDEDVNVIICMRDGRRLRKKTGTA